MPEDKYYSEAPEDERLNGEAADDELYDENEGEEAVEAEDTELDRLLDFLVETVTSAKSIPLNANMRIVNLQMCLDIVEDIRNCLPDEIRYGNEIIKHRDRILREAQTTADSKKQAAEVRANAATEDANRRAEEIVNNAEARAADIIEQAETRARAMIDQSEITRLAHEEANQICEEARAQANDTRLEANRYAETLLQNLESDLESTLKAVHESLQGMASVQKRENAARGARD